MNTVANLQLLSAKVIASPVRDVIESMAMAYRGGSTRTTTVVAEIWRSVKPILAKNYPNTPAPEREIKEFIRSQYEAVVKGMSVGPQNGRSIPRKMEDSNSASYISTQEAADFLGVSRPFVVKLVDSGVLPARMVGRYRRIGMDDLIAYKEASKAAFVACGELARKSVSGLNNEIPPTQMPSELNRRVPSLDVPFQENVNGSTTTDSSQDSSVSSG